MDSPVYKNGYWVYLRHMGNSYGEPTDRQIQNAERIYKVLRCFNYSHSAACGILGNMQIESGLSPGALQNGKTSVLPNNGESLNSLNNVAMLAFASQSGSGYGTGLIQWDSYTNEVPAGNLIASFGIRYDMLWYEGDLQLFRLESEFIYDPSGWGGVNGTTYKYWYLAGSNSPSITWTNYKNYSGTPESAADYFRENRERSSGDETGNQHRRENARYWYDKFQSLSWSKELPHKYVANMAYLFRNSGYTYSQYDCVSFVNRLVRVRLGFTQWSDNGTNSLWRDVSHEHPFSWKGTLQECYDQFGEIPIGAYLFKCYPEGTPGYNSIPDRFKNDGIGNFDHIGIYTDLGKGVMQSGGYDAGVTGVADTTFDPENTSLSRPWWTHVALDKYLIFSDDYPVPETDFPLWLLFLFNRKENLKNGRKFI